MGLVPRRAHSPPFKGPSKEGGCAIKRSCEGSLAAQTGWLVKGCVASL